ncbi:ankyrin repeat domain-containing protein [Altererythrobacter sp. KTW20L]|uniref:ankyrin repeat domain-containing protein n=1 Tax=Altererythrobacter sp. KTW20L TaxID=2942210 RepID=UPI0020BECE38|nr:ankyrin repeat domain-containing protein [Altererythrobacter sp. KTW20L]MCL6250384.1 ankyrin repeat domain-containing protein [Altererythrobacter sp. KTW20L]
MGALFKTLVKLGAAAAAFGLAAPAAAQFQSEGAQFLKAVQDRDGAKVTEMLDVPGSTVVNARDIGTGRSAMHIAVARRDSVWIDFLYQQGANVNVADNSGVTPLMQAVQLGFIEGVSKLLAHGARIDVTNNSGETPLMYAVHARNLELMRVLLQAGADPDRYDNSGRSARDYARLRGETDVTVSTIDRYARAESERATTGTSYGPRF